MPKIPFHELPNHGRLWVFPLSRSLTVAERATVLGEVDGFLAEWAAHGMPLESGCELRDDRFLLIGVDEDAEAPSGCSIDALVNRLRGLGQELGVSFIDHASVWYRAPDGVRTTSRPDFKALAAQGVVTKETHVFDTSLTRIAELRAGALERPASATWHGRAFFRERQAT
ncbi:MAG: hypothetical protein L7S64_01610 [Longimicrobiales bacterium]|nr:hypothetical protein [Longimicrobiales bacterium]